MDEVHVMVGTRDCGRSKTARAIEQAHQEQAAVRGGGGVRGASASASTSTSRSMVKVFPRLVKAQPKE